MDHFFSGFSAVNPSHRASQHDACRISRALVFPGASTAMHGAVPARDELLSTARELVSLTASCMGPAGQSKFLQVNEKKIRPVD